MLSVRKSSFLCSALFGGAVVGAVLTQWLLDWQPCVMCVEIRAWLILSSILCLIVASKDWRGAKWLAFFSLIPACMSAWKGGQLFSLEQGWVESFSCSPFAQFPKWLPLQDWVPYVFQPQAICGESIKSIIIPLSAWPALMLVVALGFTACAVFKKKY